MTLKDKFHLQKVRESTENVADALELGTLTEHEVINTAIKVYGDVAQENVAIEECAELIQAISHKHRGRSNNIAEEIADVEIMLEQLKIINNCREEVAEIHKQKIVRLFNNVCDECF